MILAEYGQVRFKLPEELTKLEPFKQVTKPVQPAPTAVKAEPTIKTVIADVAKGTLTVALMKYLGLIPKTKGTQVAEPTMISQQPTTASIAVPSLAAPRRKAPLSLVFVIGGIALVAAAFLLFRRK